jgi:hypothetical protein
MISAEPAQRYLTQFTQNLAHLVGFGIAGCKTRPINLPQCANQGVSVFTADFAIVVAVAIVETRLAHAALIVSPAGSDLPHFLWCYSDRSAVWKVMKQVYGS